MILKTINKSSFFRRLTAPVLNRWVENKINKFIHFIPLENKILDVGSGSCLITKKLKERGYNIVAIDVKNLSVVQDIIPIVYDGKKLPFDDAAFDTVLLLTVLHHSENPRELILESKRVAKELIIIEDTYGTKIQKLATQFVDLIVNFGHSKMTYQNKSEKEWERLFDDLSVEIVSKRKDAVLLFFRQTSYHIRTSQQPNEVLLKQVITK